jgi:hypothetical protein
MSRVQVLLVATLVFLISAFLFVALRSSDILAVDGAFRALEVFRRQTIFFHENNHLLYPVNVLAWSRLLSLLGLRATNPEEFYATTEIMNSIAAAGCMVILFYLNFSVSSSVRLALGVASSYGLSRAFLLHATNAAEPMVGVFWSLLAICFAGLSLKRKSQLSIVLSALCFSLAMASYQSTIFLAPAAVVLIWQGRFAQGDGRFFSLARILELGEFVAVGLAGCAVLFGCAYWREGLRSPRELMSRFIAHSDARVYLGFSVSKLLNVPIGFVRNIFPVLPGFVGIRGLLAGPKPSFIFFLIVFIGVCAFLILAARRLINSWSSLTTSIQTGVVAAIAGFVFTLIPLLIWDPQYDKLWLQPLACLAFLIGIAFLQGARKLRFSLSNVFATLLFCGLLLNFAWLVRSHQTKSPEFSEARRLASLIGPQDLLVGDWDGISNVYGYGWSTDGRFISFPTEAVIHGFDSVAQLRVNIREAQKRGGQVYFLSLLDVSVSTWDSFLGVRCGVPYSEMDSYRKQSKIRATFHSKSAELFLRQLDAPDSSNSSLKNATGPSTWLD